MAHSENRDASAEQTTLLLRLIDLAQTLSSVLSLFASRHGLSENDCYALAILSQHNAITAKSLGSLCRMHKATVSRVIRSLSRRKLVAFENNHLDRRKLTIALTTNGVAVGHEILKAAAALTDRLERPIPEAERAGLHNALLLATHRMKEIVRTDTAPARQQRAPLPALIEPASAAIAMPSRPRSSIGSKRSDS